MRNAALMMHDVESVSVRSYVPDRSNSESPYQVMKILIRTIDKLDGHEDSTEITLFTNNLNMEITKDKI